MSKKKIEAMTVKLTAEEVLGLRHIHSHWAHSNGNTEFFGNAPFCDVMSEQFLEKLGGYLELDGNLWDHPVGKKWHDSREECNECQKFFPKDEMADDEECGSGMICQECKEIRKEIRS